MINLLYVGIFFMLFLCLSLTWYQIMDMTPEEGIVFSAIFIMVGVFICGLVGKAFLIYPIMIVFAVIGLLAFVFNYSFVKDKSSQRILERIGIFFSPAIAILCILFVYTILAFKGAIFTYPDEVFQWGPAVRYIYDTGRLYYGQDFMGEALTLSIASMFQYVWVGFGAFYEKNCLIGNFILAFIPVFLPFSGTGWKHWKKVAMYTTIVFLSLNILTYVKYYTLLQDFILPLWAGSLIAWLLCKKASDINKWIFYGSLLCIGAMKSMVGPLFVGVIMILCLVNDFVLQEDKSLRFLFNGRNILRFLCSAFSGYILTFIWSLLLQQNVLNRSNGVGIVDRSFSAVVNSMIKKVFDISSNTEKSFPNISYFIMFVILFGVIYHLLLVGEQSLAKKRYVAALSLYAVGFLGYLLIMLYAYINVFSADEGKIAAGLERYLSYYMILGVPTLICLLVRERLYLKKSEQYRIIVIGIFLALVFATGNNFVEKVSAISIQNDAMYKTRTDIKDMSRIIQKLTDTEGEIFLLGEISAEESKCLMYELGGQYEWNRDCYKMSIREESAIYRNVVKYPSILEIYDYEYIWCYGDEKEKYDRLKYYCGLQSMNDGDFYKLYFENGKIEAVLLGNIKSPKKK